jgi:hypothetical protein
MAHRQLRVLRRVTLARDGAKRLTTPVVGCVALTLNSRRSVNDLTNTNNVAQDMDVIILEIEGGGAAGRART